MPLSTKKISESGRKKEPYINPSKRARNILFVEIFLGVVLVVILVMLIKLFI